MSRMRAGNSIARLIVYTLACGLAVSPLRAADHPLSHSAVTTLSMPSNGEWSHVAISPDGSRAYFGDAYSRVVVIDTASDTVAATINLPVNDYIGGIAVGPSGRVLVSTDSRLIEISPTTNQVVNNIPAAWYWRGPMVVTPGGQVAYAACYDEVYVISLAGGSIAFVDTVPGGSVDGLVAANPTWGANWHKGSRIAIDPGGDRLYLTGDKTANSLHALHTIDGLADGATTSPLTLGLYELPNPTSTKSEPQFVLSSDGAMLADSYGNLWQTSNMQVFKTVALADWSGWDPTMVAVSPNRAYIYYEGWGTLYGSQARTTYGGEELLVTSGVTYDLLDLDGTGTNGLTGIYMPAGGSAFNAHEMVISPDGTKLYLAAGSSGAMVANLSISSTFGVIVPSVGGNDGRVTVRVAGSFQSGTTAALRRSGQSDIVGSNTTIMTGGTLETRFDLTNQPTGKYDVVLTLSGATVWQLTEGFTVVEAKEEATLDLLGSRSITATASGADATVYVRAYNSGNIDLEDLIVTFNLTKGTKFTVTVPPTVPGVATSAAEQHTAGDDPVRVWISRLPPQRTYSIPVVVSGQSGTPATWTINMEASVGYIKGPVSTNSSSGQTKPLKGDGTESAIGELCTFGDALLKGINTELKRRNENPLDSTGRSTIDNVVRNTAIEYGASKVSSLIAKGLAALVVVALVPQALPVFAVTQGVISDLKSCYDFVKSLFNFAVLFPSDPNDKLCTVGVNGYLTGNEALRFRIRFENLSTATAAAQTVRVTDTLDANLDWDTLVIGESSHPDELSVAFSATTRLITWTFTELNLPPNVNPPEGQGWVEFTVKPTSGLADGTTLSNQARIYFDLNDPIDTNTVQHTIDSTAPSSAVAALSANSSTPDIPVSWSGTDAGCGMLNYTVSVSRDDGAYQVWLEQATATSGTYSGEMGSKYSFYSQARDKLGNLEAAPSQADATTTVSTSPGVAACGACGTGAPMAVAISTCVLGFMRLRRRRW